MINNNIQEILFKDIEKLEKRIRRIYYIKQIDEADRLLEKLEDIKSRLFTMSENTNEATGVDLEAKEILGEIVDLTSEVDKYMEEKGNKLVDKETLDDYRDDLAEIIDSVETNSYEENINKIRDLREKWETKNVSYILKKKGEVFLADAIILIVIEEIKAKRAIDIKHLKESFDSEILIGAIERKLIEIGKNQDEKEMDAIYDIAKNLDETSIEDEKVWEKITGEIPTFAELVEEKEKKEDKSEVKDENTSLVIPEKKLNFFDRFFMRFGNHTKGSYLTINKKRVLFGSSNKKDKIKLRNLTDDGFYKREALYTYHILYNERKLDFNFLAKYFSNLERLTLGEEVSQLQESYYQSSKLKDINMKKAYKIKEINHRMANSCPNLVSVSLPRDLNKIGDLVFIDCSRLESVDSFEGAITGPSNVFSLINVNTMPDSVEEIGIGAFARTAIKGEVRLPKFLKKLGARAYANCRRLKSIVFPFDIEEIGEDPFIGESELEWVTFQKNSPLIRKLVFPEAHYLKEAYVGGIKQEVKDYIITNYSDIRTREVNPTTSVKALTKDAVEEYIFKKLENATNIADEDKLRAKVKDFEIIVADESISLEENIYNAKERYKEKQEEKRRKEKVAEIEKEEIKPKNKRRKKDESREDI